MRQVVVVVEVVVGAKLTVVVVVVLEGDECDEAMRWSYDPL